MSLRADDVAAYKLCTQKLLDRSLLQPLEMKGSEKGSAPMSLRVSDVLVSELGLYARKKHCIRTRTHCTEPCTRHTHPSNSASEKSQL